MTSGSGLFLSQWDRSGLAPMSRASWPLPRGTLAAIALLAKNASMHNGEVIMAIDEDWKGNGIGCALLEYAVAAASSSCSCGEGRAWMVGVSQFSRTALPARAHWPDVSLDGIAVHFDASIGQKHAQAGPMAKRMTDHFGEIGFGGDFREPIQQPRLEHF
jgi:hypothetical protein